LHLTALVVVPGFLALGWWQLHRALSGNSLSWAYAFEWPFFAAYGVYLWWKLVHEQQEDSATVEAAARPAEAQGALVEDEEEDEELAAYNRYLAELSASDDRKPQ
jgi:DNA-binding transcriptional regulator of glucitol operon